MRPINWDKPLSEEDVAWLRSSGMYGVEERIRANREQFDKQYSEPESADDELTRSALDPTARTADAADNAVFPTDPTDHPEDDYDQWKVAELEAEVKARDDMENTSNVLVEGTGQHGNVTKPDLIKGLRQWDRENPNALD